MVFLFGQDTCTVIMTAFPSPDLGKGGGLAVKEGWMLPVCQRASVPAWRHMYGCDYDGDGDCVNLFIPRRLLGTLFLHNTVGHRTIQNMY